MRRGRLGHVGTQRLFLGFVSNTVHSKLISFLSEKTCLAHETSSISIIIQITHKNNKHTDYHFMVFIERFHTYHLISKSTVIK